MNEVENKAFVMSEETPSSISDKLEHSEELATALFQEEDMKEPWIFEKISSSDEDATAVKAGDVVKVHYTGALRRKEPKPEQVEFCDISDNWKATRPQPGGKVVIRPFDSTLSRGRKPIKFRAGATPREVVVGFDECLLAMRLGDKGILRIRSDAGYGKPGCPPRDGAPVDDKGIPPSTDIVFIVELLSINGEDAPAVVAEAVRQAEKEEKERKAAEDSFLDGIIVPPNTDSKQMKGSSNKSKKKRGSNKNKK